MVALSLSLQQGARIPATFLTAIVALGQSSPLVTSKESDVGGSAAAVVLTVGLLLGPVAVLAGLVLTATSASAATAVTVVAEADSYTDSAQPTVNFGRRTSFPIDASPQQTAYLKFDIPNGTDLSGGVKLRVFAQSTHSTGVTSYSVANTTWTETGITYDNAPPVGEASGKSGPLAASTWAEIDVASAVKSTGKVSLALKTASSTALRITSREGTNKPQLVIGGTTTSPQPTEFTVSPVAGGPYQAVSDTTTYTGTLKSVVQQAVPVLRAAGGGTIKFTSGDFDFGSDYFVLVDVTNIEFVGAGIDPTVIKNYSDAAADTEPFSFTRANGIKIRNMTVAAGGTARTSSDAIDFDAGNNSLVENVKITASRARGIVFDGKDAGVSAESNTVRNCRDYRHPRRRSRVSRLKSQHRHWMRHHEGRRPRNLCPPVLCYGPSAQQEVLKQQH